ncbi:radical SAM protein [candidate division KSB1 bacterium]|nr:radical SAM protein [candidate division KSB1 bacterium]
MKKFKYLFGPVPSRRFGLSLGVDLTPFKTCSFDCVFCQLGRTTNHTTERKEYVPMDGVCNELNEWLSTNGQADYITLAGSGEPTLHSRFGDVLEFIRTHTRIPAVLLTNGTLLDQPGVQEAAARAHIVKVSLSVWDTASYVNINHPHPNLKFDQLVEGLIQFRANFKGRLWMEVFLIDGMNSGPNDVKKIAQLARQINPDCIHLNTAVRPVHHDFVKPLTGEELNSLAPLFDPPAEVIPEFKTTRRPDFQTNEDTLLEMLRRRPCTSEQIAGALGLHLNEVSKYVGKLLRTNRIRKIRKDDNVYYCTVNK